MAAPTAPTKTTIVTEALKRGLNGGTPTAAAITRGEDYGLEKVKRDIMSLGKTWRPLLKTAYDITVVGVPNYANAADFEADLSVHLMYGSHTGLLTGVASTSNVTLAADEDATQAECEGKWLLLTSGTGVDQAQPIDNYSATTKVAALSTAYGTLPVIGDGYMVVNDFRQLRKIPVSLYDLYRYPGTAGTPVKFASVPDDTVGVLMLTPVPSAIFGLKRRYYADLMKLDLTGTLYATILRRWAGVLEQGVYVWDLGQDDDRYVNEVQVYQAMLVALMANDLDGFDREAAKQVASGVQ